MFGVSKQFIELIIANAETHEPIDILPNRRLQTIKAYLQKYGQDVEIVVMDMNGSFKAAIHQALAKILLRHMYRKIGLYVV